MLRQISHPQRRREQQRHHSASPGRHHHHQHHHHRAASSTEKAAIATRSPYRTPSPGHHSASSYYARQECYNTPTPRRPDDPSRLIDYDEEYYKLNDTEPAENAAPTPRHRNRDPRGRVGHDEENCEPNNNHESAEKVTPSSSPSHPCIRDDGPLPSDNRSECEDDRSKKSKSSKGTILSRPFREIKKRLGKREKRPISDDGDGDGATSAATNDGRPASAADRASSSSFDGGAAMNRREGRDPSPTDDGDDGSESMGRWVYCEGDDWRRARRDHRGHRHADRRRDRGTAHREAVNSFSSFETDDGSEYSRDSTLTTHFAPFPSMEIVDRVMFPEEEEEEEEDGREWMDWQRTGRENECHVRLQLPSPTPARHEQPVARDVSQPSLAQHEIRLSQPDGHNHHQQLQEVPVPQWPASVEANVEEDREIIAPIKLFERASKEVHVKFEDAAAEGMSVVEHQEEQERDKERHRKQQHSPAPPMQHQSALRQEPEIETLPQTTIAQRSSDPLAENSSSQPSITADESSSRLPSKSFAEKKLLIQNSLNFGQLQNKPLSASLDEGILSADISPNLTKAPKTTGLPSRLNAPQSTIERGSKEVGRALHTSLMMEMMSKLGNKEEHVHGQPPHRMPPKEIVENKENSQQPPESFAEKKRLIQNTLNFGRFQNKPPKVTNQEDAFRRQPQAAARKEEVDTEVAASKTIVSPNQKIPLALEGPKQAKELHGTLVAEMMSKFGNESSTVATVSSEVRKQQQSCQPLANGRRTETETLVSDHKVSSKERGELTVSSKQSKESKLEVELQRMKRRMIEREEEMDQKVSRLEQELCRRGQDAELKMKNEELASQLQHVKGNLREHEEKMGNRVSGLERELQQKKTELRQRGQYTELKLENEELAYKLQRVKGTLCKHEEEMGNRVSELERELQQKKTELRHMSERERELKAVEGAESQYKDYVKQLTADLDASRAECSSYRENILQMKRENAKVERSFFEERKKVQSLESENTMLLDIADDCAGLAAESERATDDELNLQTEQSNKHRLRILDLERKVLAAEEALDATGRVAEELEQGNKTIDAQLRTLQATNEFLESKLEDKESEVTSLQSQVSTLKTKCLKAANVTAEAKRREDDNLELTRELEGENATLLRKLDVSAASLAKLQLTAEQCQQLEDENLTLRKRNADLVATETKMAKEMDTERLGKITAEELRNDLLQARSSHLEALHEMRSKHSAEMNITTEKMHSEKQARRALETENNELKDKIQLLERNFTELEHRGTCQTKSQSDQLRKLMDHADQLRMKHAESQADSEKLRHEFLERSNTNHRFVKELQDQLNFLEEEKSVANEILTETKAELVQLRNSKIKERKDLEQIIHGKDHELAKLESNFSEYVAEKTAGMENLQLSIQQLERELEQTTLSRQALKTQFHDAKRYFLDAISSVKIEKITLLADVQSQISNEKVALTRQVKSMICSYGDRAERVRLEQSMCHSVAMSTIQSEKRDVERRLNREKEKTASLGGSLDKAMADNQAFKETFQCACKKLSAIDEESLIKAIDDVLIDRSDARMQVRTLEADVTFLKSNNDKKEKRVKELESSLKKEHCALRVQTEEYSLLEKKIAKLKHEGQIAQDQMKAAFDSEQRAKEKSMEDIVLVKEEALSQQKDLRDTVETLTKEIANRGEQLVQLQGSVDESRHECQDVAENLARANAELAKAIETKKKDVEDLGQIILEKDNSLAKVQRDFSEYAAGKTAGIENLQSTIEQLEQELKFTTSSKEALKRHIYDVHRRFLDAKNSIRIEKTSLLADVQDQISNQRVILMKDVKDMVRNYGERAESYRVNQSMCHSAAMSTMQLANIEVERLLSTQKEKAGGLEDSLDKARADNQVLVEIVDGARRKLGIGEEESLYNEIDKILIAGSSSRDQIKNIEADKTTLKSHVKALKTKNHNLECTNATITAQMKQKENQIKELETALERDRQALRIQLKKNACFKKKFTEAQCTLDQMKATFDADRRAQYRSVEEILSAKEVALLRQEELQQRVDTLTKEIADRNGQLVVLQGAVDVLRKECQDATSKYENAASKYEEYQCQVASLHEMTVVSKNKDDELGAMKKNLPDVDDKLTAIDASTSRENLTIGAEDDDADATMKDVAMDTGDKTVQIDAGGEENFKMTSNIVPDDSSMHIGDIFVDHKLEMARAELEHFRDTKLEALRSWIESERAKHTNAMEALENDTHSMEMERDALAQQIHDLSSAQAALDHTNKELKSKLEEEHAAHEHALNALQNEIFGITMERDALNRREECLSSSLTILQSSQDAKDAAITKLESKLEEDRIAHHEALKTLQIDHDTALNQSSKTLQDTIRTITMERDYLTREVEGLSSTLSSLQSSFDTNDATSRELKLTLEKERRVRDNDLNTLKNDVRGVTDERDSLTRRVESLSSALSSLQSSFDTNDATSRELKLTLEKERIVHDNDLNTLKNNIRGVTDERDSLTRRVEGLASAIEALRSSEATKDSTLKELKLKQEEERTLHANTVSDLESSSDTKSATIKGLESRLKEEHQVHSKIVEDLQGDVDRMAKKKDDLTQQMQDLTSTMTELKSFNEGEIQTMHSTLEAERLKYATAVSDLQSLETILENERRVHKKALVALQTDICNMSTESNGLTKTIANRDEQILELRETVDESKRKCEDAVSKYDQCKGELAHFENKADELMNHYMSIEDELRNKLQSVLREKKELEYTVTSSKGEMEQATGEFDKEKRKFALALELKDNSIRELKSQIEEMKQNKIDAQNHRDVEISELKKGFDIEMDDLKREFEKEKHDLSQVFYKEKDDLTSTLALKESSTRELENLVDELMDSKAEAEKHSETLSNEIAAFKHGNVELKERNHQVCSERDKLELALAELESTKCALTSRIESERVDHASAVKTLQSDIHNIKMERDSLNQREKRSLSTLAVLQSSQDTTDARNKAALHTLTQRVTELQLSQEAKDALIRGLETTLESERQVHCDALKTLHAELESPQSSLDEWDATNKDPKSTLEEDCTLNTNALKSLQKNVRSIVSEKNSLNLQVDKISSDLASLKLAYGAKNDIVDELKFELEEQRAAHANANETLENDIRSITSEKDSLTLQLEDSMSTLAVLQLSQDTKDATIKEMESKLEEVQLVHTNNMENLQGDIDCMAMKNDALTQQMDVMTSTIAQLKSFHEIGNQNMMAAMEAERLEHAKAVSELQSVLNQQLATSNMQAENVEEMREEAKHLRDEIDKQLEAKSEQERQIRKLEDSLGSKVNSEQAKLTELMRIIPIEDQSVQSKQCLQSSRSEVDGITSLLSTQKPGHSDLKLVLKNIVHEKKNLEDKISVMETNLSGTMTKLTHSELKLTNTEQERDKQFAEITLLQNDLHSLEKSHQGKEQNLMNQIATLQKAREQGKERCHNLKVCSMRNEAESLMKKIEYLTEDNDKLTCINENINAKNKCILAEKISIADNLASLQSKLAEHNNDGVSTFSGSAMAFHLKQTASEMETTVMAIKKHHSESTKKLQRELDDARKRIKKYERKVNDLTKLLEENSYLIESLHKKLKCKMRPR